jgi:brefeldin A-inhibited guanine nucleotide-exchange protein
MSFKQKAVVLESLRGLCGNPFLLTQIFLHYDCDFDAPNLYKDIVHSLTKLGGKATASTPPVNKKEAEQEFELSLAGMEVLVTILKAFLQALGLNVDGEEDADDLAGGKIREMLNLNVKLASQNNNSSNGHKQTSDESVASSDMPSQPAFPKAAKAVETETSAEGAGRIVDAFETKRKAEQNFEIGAVKFNLSLKNGLLFFIENNFVELDARAIARFFLVNRDKLDKTQMGEALGREPDAAFVKEEGIDPDKGGPGFWLRILHHYVDAQEFTGLMFDDAIRSFLSGFRLPGEAQKIDRIMEKFAERFTAQNPEIFPSADTAFILAFSVIMLNTDLHNPSIKPEKRMTADSFVKNNRGIGENGSDLPEDFLKGIFERIKDRPFSLKEDDLARERAGIQTPRQIFDASAFFDGSALFGAADTEEKKRERFKQERDEMMAATQKLIRQRPATSEKSSLDASKLTDSIPPGDVIKPMFDVTWGPMIGILSQVLECTDDERMVSVCLHGFQYAVKLASPNHMSLTRDTFVSSLAKFTFLGSIKEMKQKNVESIRTLLEIAISDGEHLGDSWGSVLQCISQLARLRLSASGLDSDESFLIEKDKLKPSPTAPKMGGFFRSSSSRSQQFKIDSARETEEMNGRAVLESIQEVLIDKVFSSTVNLSARSLAHFISQLITVSSTEIDRSSHRSIAGVESLSGTTAISDASRRGKGDGPSIFSLQRLVDVADYNMDVRPRLVWTQIWELMADYFAQNACHSNAMVSVFAIDSLKQLSFKFLDKPELSEFNFQRLFLNPFLVVMENKNSREDIRDLVLQCVDNIIRTKACNLRSGWKVIFSILTCSANDPSEKIETLGIAILQRLLDEHLDDVFRVEGGTDASQENADLTITEKRNRNVHTEDFVNLCKTSLSFVIKEEFDLPRPVGLSMRALCHTAIYADLLAARRVLPPETSIQVSNY